MKSIISKIFCGLSDEEIHSEFIKFSKGLFENRYLIEAKKQKEQWAIKTSAEFANFFVRQGLERANSPLHVTGAIISTLDLKKEFEFPIDDIKQYMGIKQYLVDAEIEPSKILKLMNAFPRAFYALSFSLPGYELKIKAKAPKSGKPSNKGNDEGPKADFCTLKTNNKEVIEDLFFDAPSFEEIRIKHSLQITDIVLPKGVSDPKEIREKAQRKGVLKRCVINGGKEAKSEKVFVA